MFDELEQRARQGIRGAFMLAKLMGLLTLGSVLKLTEVFGSTTLWSSAPPREQVVEGEAEKVDPIVEINREEAEPLLPPESVRAVDEEPSFAQSRGPVVPDARV